MGIIKKIHQSEKGRKKMLGDRAEDFRNEVVRIGKEYKMRIVPVIKREGLELDIKCFGGFSQRFKKKEFREKIAKLARNYGMAIVPKFGEYELGVEIQILQDKSPDTKTGTPYSNVNQIKNDAK